MDLSFAVRPASGTPATSPGGLAGAVAQWWRARTRAGSHLRLVETLQLGPRRSVALIELDGQRFLAAMGADGVNTLLPVPPATASGDSAGVHAR